MKKILASAFFIILGITLITAYSYLPIFISENIFYSKLINGIFITGIVLSFLFAIGVIVKGG